MEVESIGKTVDRAMEELAAKREAAGMGDQAKAEVPVQESHTEKKAEITLKFGKGCVGEAFKGKDGKDYKQILIPNKDQSDHSPWATFVVRASAVHDDKFGKGMWLKLPADGHTTIRKDHCVGEGADGKKVWETEKTKVPNRDLKGMVEFYKSRGKEQEQPRESMQAKLAEKSAQVAEAKAAAPAQAHHKAKENAL